MSRLSLQVDQGERHAIVGPNGAGKTTLFNLISGTERLTSGEIILFGQDVSNMPAYRRAAMGLARTFQVTTLFQSLTVFENVLLATQAETPFRLAIYKPVGLYSKVVSQAEKIVSQWNLEDKQDLVVSSLSYGAQRQLEVIMALAKKPRVLLLDEPTAGLSPFETSEMSRFLRSLDGSVTLLIIEHDMDVVFSLANKITVMHFGKIIAQGTPKEIKGHPEVTAIYLGARSKSYVNH